MTSPELIVMNTSNVQKYELCSFMLYVHGYELVYGDSSVYFRKCKVEDSTFKDIDPSRVKIARISNKVRVARKLIHLDDDRIGFNRAVALYNEQAKVSGAVLLGDNFTKLVLFIKRIKLAQRGAEIVTLNHMLRGIEQEVVVEVNGYKFYMNDWADRSAVLNCLSNIVSTDIYKEAPSFVS